MRLERPAFLSTELGAAYVGDARELLRDVPDCSVSLILTSPPYALQRRKDYDNVPAGEYVEWFMPFALEFQRILRDDGSLVLNIGGAWDEGQPTRSAYQFELLLRLMDHFHLAQDFYWFNSARLPTPAEWVAVRRIRAKDAVEFLWWLSKRPDPKADNRRIRTPYSKSMKRLLARGTYNEGPRPSGHNISGKFGTDNDGAIPPNFILCGNTSSNDVYLRRCRARSIRPHPARFPRAIPDLFIRFLTDEGDMVVDPFAGSCLTGAVAEELGRRWMCFELVGDYLEGAALRFESGFARGVADDDR